jgi:hypothetical protein
LQLVPTSASQPEVFTPPHTFGGDKSIVSDALYRALRLAQAPLVNNGICAPRHQPREPRKVAVSHLSIHFFGLRSFGHCIIILHKLCLIDLHKLCIIILHKLC